MAIKGVNPSYFAGMPTVALDPNAGKENPQYAQMLSQAMQHRAQATDRRRESDEENAFKARTLDQQARRDRMSNDISKRNTAVSEAGEARLKSGQEFTQGRLKSVDTEHLIDALNMAKYTHDKVAEEYFLAELETRGVQTRNRAPAPADQPAEPPPAEPPPAAPPIDRSPMPPRSPPPTASFPPVGEAEAAPPMRGAPAGVAPRSTASFPPVGAGAAPPPGPAPTPAPTPAPAAAPPGRPMMSDSDQFYRDMEWKPPPGKAPRAPAPARPMASDDAQFYKDMEWHPPTEKELLDRAIADVVAREAAGLTPTAKPLLPGKTLRRSAAEADQMLSPDDPLLNRRAQ